jgi:hypothetical protein
MSRLEDQGDEPRPWQRPGARRGYTELGRNLGLSGAGVGLLRAAVLLLPWPR